jgi:hypothetical protein
VKRFVIQGWRRASTAYEVTVEAETREEALDAASALPVHKWTDLHDAVDDGPIEELSVEHEEEIVDYDEIDQRE